MPALETELLAELVAKKHQLLTQLRDLGRLQIELIQGDDYDQLMRVLSAKQRLLGGLQGVEQELNPFRGQDPDARVWRSPSDREHCARVIADSASIFAEIVQQERLSETQMSTRRDEAAARLEGVHAASQARGAYGQGGTAGFGTFEAPAQSSWSMQG